MNSFIKMFVIFIIVILTSGCATGNNRQVQSILNEDQKINQDLRNAVGKMSFDEAISMFGQPDKLTDGQSIRVAEWLGSFDNFRLSFDKTTNLLVSYTFESNRANYVSTQQHMRKNQTIVNIGNALSKAFQPKPGYVYKDRHGNVIGSMEER